MKYIITTANADKFRNTIFSCVECKKDSQGNVIRTWDVATLKDSKEKVLIHTTDQWEDKGNLHLIPSKDNKELEVSFCYWSKFNKEERFGNEDRYLFGRFTELLLVHFWVRGLKVEISD